ncbi:cadherin-9 isoform X2 [Patella vulgata]|uniref:cadherin-9 isoform X2 n=1 Tax=Patella vulgata TaxID=6465 RepID=UPI0021804E0D|nr:cadherin-9 isoform X2 [Patella vulgata]
MLENMPLDGNLPEGTNAITTIKCLTCTGVVPYTVRFVSVSPSTGCGNCFNIWDEDEMDGTPNYCLKFVPGTNQLDYEKVSVYSVIVECVDANGRANRGQIEVRILPNSPPIITSSSSVSVSLPDKTVGSPVFQIEATDPNNDDLQYTLTPESRSSSDTFQIDNNGRITLKQNIENSCETSYSLSAYVTDSYNDRQGPVNINIEVENPNTPPTTDLLNQQISIDENTGTGTRLVNLGLLDASSSIMTVRPSNMEKHFTLKDGQLSVNTPFNYEVDNKANISFTFSNGFCESKYWLVVNVNDVNDEPELSPQVQSAQVEEGYVSTSTEEE